MKLSFLCAIKQNKSWLGLTFVFILSFFSGYSNPIFSKTPTKVQTEWVSYKKEVKANNYSNKFDSAQFVNSTFSQGSFLFSELHQSRLALIKCKNNRGISITPITSILASRNLPKSEEEDSFTS
jgi:hypothetical protein